MAQSYIVRQESVAQLLALIVLFDQVRLRALNHMYLRDCSAHNTIKQLPRNIFRKTPAAFKYDKIALVAAMECLVPPALNFLLSSFSASSARKSLIKRSSEPRRVQNVPAGCPQDVHHHAIPAQVRNSAQLL